MPTDALAAVADELYALPPDEFTAARNDRAKAVRADDRELASRIQELRRPSPAAWLVNQLVRHRSDELDAILDLGAELREAQEELDARALSRLARQRRQLVSALARDAADLADELGNPVRGPALDEVAETLQAGMSDASAADAVRSGRLVRALEAVGLDVDLEGAVAGGPAPAGSSRARTQAASGARAGAASDEREAEPRDDARAEAEARKARERAERAERAAREAEERADAAEAALEELDDRVEEHRRRISELTEERDELEERLRRVESELADAERELRPVARDRDRATRSAEEARAAADEARAGVE
jgi:chromosome segregation ATPase